MAPHRAAPDAAAASASPVAIPNGLYGKYKHATNFFLRWLLQARSVGLSNSSTAASKKKKGHEPVTLAAYEEIVTLIAQEPTRLAPSLLQQWTRALAACETAITLRAHVALPEDCFPAKEDDESTPIRSRTATKAPAASCTGLLEDSFESYLHVDLSFLVMELEELEKVVYDAFLAVNANR